MFASVARTCTLHAAAEREQIAGSSVPSQAYSARMDCVRMQRLHVDDAIDLTAHGRRKMRTLAHDSCMIFHCGFDCGPREEGKR